MKLRGPLLLEGRHALLAVAERGPEHRQRVGEVRLERLGGGAVAVEQLLGQPQGDGGAVDHERAGQATAAGSEVVGLVHRADQPAGQGRVGVEDLGGVDPLERLLDADDPRQEPGGRGLGDDAEAAEDEADPGRGRGEPQVHREGHRGADADRGPVDRRDDRLRQRVDRQGHLAAGVADPVVRASEVGAQLLRGRPQGLVEPEDVALGGQVHPGAEGPAGAGDHDRADRVVAGVGQEELLELARHGQVERVELVGAAQRQRGHAGVVDRDVEGLVGRLTGSRRSGSRASCRSTRCRPR